MHKIIGIFVFLLATILWIPSYASSQEFATILTLPEAVQLALDHEPALKQTRSNISALQHQAIAAGQLPDPKLSVGINNLPTKNFSFTSDDMTMEEVGLMQTFPAGSTLAHKQKQTQNLAIAEQERYNDQALALTRDVSNTWLELYYTIHAKSIITANQRLLKNIAQTTKSQYASGKNTQASVLQAQLEVTKLDDKQYDKQYELQQQIDALRATLSGWIGQGSSQLPLPQNLPKLPTCQLTSYQNTLVSHPLLKMDNANIQAAQNEIALSKDQYKPGFDVVAGVGLRQGSDSSGMKRSNFVSAQITMDLPFFTAKRQDQNLQASKDKFVAAELDRQIHYRNLRTDLASQYAAFARLSEREAIYNKEILPKAKNNIKSTLLAYQSNTTDLITVLHAYSIAFDLELEKLRIMVDKTKAQININYLSGISAKNGRT